MSRTLRNLIQIKSQKYPQKLKLNVFSHSGLDYLFQLELSDPVDAAANGLLAGTPHLMERLVS